VRSGATATATTDGSPAPAGWAIFVDFDGTITDRDTFDVLVNRFGSEAAWLGSQLSLDDGSKTLREVLQIQASFVRGSFAAIAALLEREVTVDPEFAPFVAACRKRGVALTVVSSGIEPIIRGRLAALGLADVPVVANGIDPLPDGWVIQFRDGARNGTDKAAIVREAAVRGMRTIFIGDGVSDYDAALIADVRFAKQGLALERYLLACGIAFESFSSFAEVAAKLAL